MAGETWNEAFTHLCPCGSGAEQHCRARRLEEANYGSTNYDSKDFSEFTLLLQIMETTCRLYGIILHLVCKQRFWTFFPLEYCFAANNYWRDEILSCFLISIQLLWFFSQLSCPKWQIRDIQRSPLGSSTRNLSQWGKMAVAFMCTDHR